MRAILAEIVLVRDIQIARQLRFELYSANIELESKIYVPFIRIQISIKGLSVLCFVASILAPPPPPAVHGVK